MPVGIIFNIAVTLLQHGLGATVVPTPQPYIAQDQYGFNVGLDKTVHNRNPAHRGPIQWKEKIEIGPFTVDWPKKR